MGTLEQSHRDDWRLSRQSSESFYVGNAAHYHNEEEIRAHLIDARKYNGWTNYETWSVNLVLSNTQELDRLARRIARHAFDKETDEELKRVRAADTLKTFVNDEWLQDSLEHLNNAGDAGMLASQLVTASLSEVDWLEIADAFLEA